MTRTETALARFNEGYNCAQSVLCAFAGDFGLSGDLALKIASGFGAGLGKKQELCGAVSGAVMTLGLKYGGSGAGGVKENNGLTRKKVQEFIIIFKEEKGTLVCKDLLRNYTLQNAAGEGTAFVNLREHCCTGLVARSCELIEKLLAADDAP